MKSLKTILVAALVAAALVAIPASAQTSGGDDADSTNAALLALVESQQAVIESQQAVIASQQVIIETQQALLDAQLGGGGSDAAPARQHTEAEIADAAVVCPFWTDETESIVIRRANWVAFAQGLEAGIVQHITLEAAVPALIGERDRIAATIPLLTSEQMLELMADMEQAADVIIKGIETGESDETLIELINEALDAFDALEAGFVFLCDLDLE